MAWVCRAMRTCLGVCVVGLLGWSGPRQAYLGTLGRVCGILARLWLVGICLPYREIDGDGKIMCGMATLALEDGQRGQMDTYAWTCGLSRRLPSFRTLYAQRPCHTMTAWQVVRERVQGGKRFMVWNSLILDGASLFALCRTRAMLQSNLKTWMDSKQRDTGV